VIRRPRGFGILTRKVPLLGWVPDLSRPHVELMTPGAIWGVGHPGSDGRFEIAERAAREGHIIRPSLAFTLTQWQRDSLRKRGARFAMAGGGQQESYRALGASFAVTSTIHAHIKILGGAGSGQATFCMAECSYDGTSGIATLELDSSTEATAGTAGTAPTTTQVRRYPAVTPVTTVSGNYTAEGTAYTAINIVLLPMPTGPFVVQYPLGRELETQPTAATLGKALIMRGSVTVNCNQRGMIEFEE
jgi:hypothetical protein